MLRTSLSRCVCPVCMVDEGLRATHSQWIEMMAIFSERQARLYAAEKAMGLGHGGITRVAQVLGLSERTIRRGVRELQAGNLGEMAERSRHPGAGRKWSEEIDPSLVDDLELLMGENTAGDPMRLLKWTTKSLRSLADELSRKGHPVSHTTVHRLLRELDYSLWGNRRSIEGKQHPQRDAQFRYLYQQVKRCLRAKIPVISVDSVRVKITCTNCYWLISRVCAMIAGCRTHRLSHGLGRSIRRCGQRWTSACDDNGRLRKRGIWVGVA